MFPQNSTQSPPMQEALPATKVTKTGKQLKLGLPFPGLWLSTWLRKRQTDDSVSSPSHITAQFSFEPEVTWLCYLWPNKDALFPVLWTLGLAWASLVETISAPKTWSFSRDKLHAAVERGSRAVQWSSGWGAVGTLARAKGLVHCCFVYSGAPENSD